MEAFPPAIKQKCHVYEIFADDGEPECELVRLDQFVGTEGQTPTP
jgi:hypothetical protein